MEAVDAGVPRHTGTSCTPYQQLEESRGRLRTRGTDREVEMLIARFVYAVYKC